MILTSGGRFGGYGFYLLKGKPVWLWNVIPKGESANFDGRHSALRVAQSAARSSCRLGGLRRARTGRQYDAPLRGQKSPWRWPRRRQRLYEDNKRRIEAISGATFRCSLEACREILTYNAHQRVVFYRSEGHITQPAFPRQF
jgi:hypothetical protein